MSYHRSQLTAIGAAADHASASRSPEGPTRLRPARHRRRCMFCRRLSEYPVVYGHIDGTETVALCSECRADPEALKAKDSRFDELVKAHRTARNATTKSSASV